MRYWIWWNDLIQGPFEPDELASLKAFSEDLLVCMEDRQDWLPASRVADLSAEVEQLRIRLAAPKVPPPPPPRRSPSVTPLQGEFFADPPGQEHLLDTDEGAKGPFAYYPAIGESETPPWAYLRGEATMPFHFLHQPAAAQTAVIELPRPIPARIMVSPQPVIRESPVPKPVEEGPIPLSILEPTSKPMQPAAFIEIAASRAPTFEEFSEPEPKAKWLVWVLGVALALGALGTLSFWLIDRAGAPSVVSESQRPAMPKTMDVPRAQALPPDSSMIPAKPLGEAVKKVDAGSPAVEPLFVSPPAAAHTIQSPVPGDGVLTKHTVIPRGLRRGIHHLFALFMDPRPITAGDDVVMTQSPGTGVPQAAYLSAVTGASLGAKSGMGTVGGTAVAKSGLGIARSLTSTLSSLSSAIRRNFSKPVSPRTSSEAQAVNEISPYGQPMPPQGGNASQALAAADASHTLPKVTAEGGSAVATASALSSTAGLVASKRRVAQRANTISSKHKTFGPLSAGVQHRPSLHQKKPHQPKGDSASWSGSAEAAAGNAEGQPMKAPGAEVSPVVPAAAAIDAVSTAMPGLGASGAPGSSPSSIGSPISSAHPSGQTAQAISSAAGQSVAYQASLAVTAPVSPPKPDPWKGKQTEAIALVQNKTLPKSKITIGNQARAMLQQMHEKELLHAAATGERLYLPDKMAWSALQEDGSRYRVYLNFFSWQDTGERVQSRSYQFIADVNRKEVRADDARAQEDLLSQPAELTFKHNPMASDIDSILGGVDTFNKHKVQLIIIKQSRRNRDDRKKIEAALAAAREKIARSVVYFRRTYPTPALENVAKAYAFSELLKG